MAVDGIWDEVARHSNETFETKTGIPFSYTVRGNVLHLHNTNHTLSRTQFEDAAARVGITKPFDLRDLRGPSYTWAILQDSRIGAY